MKLSDHLEDEKKRKSNHTSKPKKRKKKKPELDYKELMGQYKTTYKRGKGGAIKQK
ncbi:hypothetical protein [Halalkalibacter krulwichiae]|uniref:Uncharacterized protein n=1 Tax=Halalkalibacter krulwichiae TaxID=199441 RepID=A0A1X9MIM5_9BACI|nr:hypothetical protein [Halalkalibacter krulwichiae]ARK32143.1 hypothetical protein BkAM31D_21115 [Halalkalibacter krulwichiae]